MSCQLKNLLLIIVLPKLSHDLIKVFVIHLSDPRIYDGFAKSIAEVLSWQHIALYSNLCNPDPSRNIYS